MLRSDRGELEVELAGAIAEGFVAEAVAVADLAARFNRLTRRGFAAYAATTCRMVFGYRPETYAIRNGI